MVYQTARTQDETIETILGVEFLDLVKETCYHVVTARSLTARKDDTYVHLLGVSLSSGLELYDRHTVGVREQLLDFLLVAHTLSCLTLLDLYSTLKSLWQLRLISSSCFLQCTFFHLLIDYIV